MWVTSVRKSQNSKSQAQKSINKLFYTSSLNPFVNEVRILCVLDPPTFSAHSGMVTPTPRYKHHPKTSLSDSPKPHQHQAFIGSFRGVRLKRLRSAVEQAMGPRRARASVEEDGVACEAVHHV